MSEGASVGEEPFEDCWAHVANVVNVHRVVCRGRPSEYGV
jgi:hypothetical protein